MPDLVLATRTGGTATLAAEHGLRVAVRGAGHNVAGAAMADGGLVIDLSGLKAEGATAAVPAEPVARQGSGGRGGVLGRCRPKGEIRTEAATRHDRQSPYMLNR